MKKILSILFIGLISILIVPFNVDAKSISTLDVTNNNNKLTVSGTTENGVLAVAVLVYSEGNLTHMETCANNNNKYSCELSKTFETGNYTVKVADYNGGEYISKDINTKNNSKEDNPETLDKMNKYMITGFISLIGILGITIYNKNKKNVTNK